MDLKRILMQQRINLVLKLAVFVVGLTGVSFTLQAKETPKVDQAMFHCKTTYPSQFESKKRLACFDSISPPGLEPLFKEALADVISSEKSTEVIPKNEEIPTKVGAVAIKKPIWI